jgi:threonyl-tRNA synthetase
MDGLSWRTTPYEIACDINKRLAEKCIVAKVNGEIWDLERPFEKSCHLQLLGPDDKEAQVS